MRTEIEPNFPLQGRLLSLDIGKKRTGLAISDEMRWIASPLATIEFNHREQWVNEIKTIIEEYSVVGILVGIPLNQYGEEGQDAKNILGYVDFLRQKTNLPILEWDERFSTVQAERQLIEADLSRKKRKEVIDKVVAAILLQNYLDSVQFSIKREEE